MRRGPPVRARAPAAALAAALLAGCSSRPSEDPWFPLAEGHEWTYRTVLRLGEEPAQSGTLTISARGAEPLAPGGTPAFRRHADNGIDYWLRTDATGVLRVATRGPLERQPRLDKETRYVLQKPYAVGTQWKATTTSYVLMRRNEVPREVGRIYPSFPMTYRIEATDAKVETPAGRYSGCLRVGGIAEIKLWVDEQRAFRDVPLLSTEWYCRDVGLVKVERREDSPSKFFVGGTMVMELAGFR